MSGGEYYPQGCTVTGTGKWVPECTHRRFAVPVYVIPADTFDALFTPPDDE